MKLTELLIYYWWIPIPFLAMFIGIFSIWAHYNHKRHTLNLIKTYLDKGIEPPQSLLDHLRSDEDREYDAFGHHPKKPTNALSSASVFAALSGGFGYFGYMGNHDIFIALAIALGISSVAIILVHFLFRSKKD
jgi:hypothetical protein